MGETNPNPMRVLLVTHYFAEQGGGIERVAAQLARHLRILGAEVVWIASDTCPISESANCASKCVPVTAWDGIQRATGAPWPVWSPGALLKLWKLVRESSVVHIHDSLYMGNVLAYTIAKLHRRPVVVTQHVSDIPFKSPLLKAALWLAYQSAGRMLLGGANQVVFISEEVCEDFRHRFQFKRPPRFIPNGVDSALFCPVNEEVRDEIRSELLGTARDKLVFLFAGRFVEKKGLAILRRIAEKMPHVNFFMLGQGPIDPKSWGLENVFIPGAVGQEIIARYYQASDLLVLPSVGEGLPLVVQEAMSTGLPVAVSSRTARADSVATPFLLHAPCTDECTEDEVVTQWTTLLGSFDSNGPSTAELRKRMRQMAADRWSWSRCAAQYLEIFCAHCGS